ncbi:MAG: iron hydrogenase small subunit [Solobacterium sp.]|nr:iron hydrogenase small subunit [Solobacterium sp.]
MTEVHLKINNINVTAEAGDTVLEAARKNGVHIPTLCYLKDINKSGACRVCLVEVKNARTLLSACTTPVSENMEVFTNSERAIEGRRTSVELILSNHNRECLSCKRNQNCELQKVAEELGIRENRFEGDHTPATYDDFSTGIVRDTSKCILCGRCIETCKKVQGLGILGFEHRGFQTIVSPVYNMSFNNVECMQCGQCVINCPVGALTEKEDLAPVIRALNDPTKKVIVQTAPAVRAALGEEFGLPIGTRVTGKMAAALRRCGFTRVYDTNFAADLTIMEEGSELLRRLNNGGVLPMFTSCSPGWVRYLEFEYPDLLPNVSSAKSPHMMFGAIAKSYWAKNNNVDPKDVFVVSIMPCIAKKAEIVRPECNTTGLQDVDAVLTTRECARLIKMFGIDFNELPDEGFDMDFMGEYTGAGVIFGASGGVMEAALRTVKQQLEGVKLEPVDFEACRGMAGVKEAEIELAGAKIWIAITSSMSAAKPLLDEVRAGTSKYTFIEVMGCPGGCINGGGQPIVPSKIKNGKLGMGYKELRMKTLYDEDTIKELRVSSDNPQIQQLYKDFLGEPGSELAEELLHTSYAQKEKFKVFND